MHTPHPSPQIGAATLLLAELTAGAGGGQLAHALSVIPPWLGGALSALAVGAVLRIVDPLLRDWGEGLRTAWRRFRAR